MLKQEKKQVVDRIEEALTGSNFLVVLDHRGLTVADLTSFRRHLRQAGTKYMVVKNTLANQAARKAKQDGLLTFLQGPTSIAFCRSDPQEMARSLTGYLRTSKSPLNIKGGLLDGRVLTADDIQSFALLPSREVLLARVAGSLQLPLASLMGMLAANMTALAQVLKGRVAQLEGQGAK